MRLATTTAAWSTLALLATAASADEIIDTVTVIGVTPLTGSLVDRNRVAAPVQTASSKQIERSHALDLTSYMNRHVGSVYVNDIQNNSLQPDVNYRGYTASPLLGTPQGLSVYLDGMRLNQPFGDVVSWDLLPKEALASMTLIPGSNPVFGSNTLGGALALQTKDGISYPGYGVEVNYGSYNRQRVAASAASYAENGLHWFATGNELRDDGWRDDSPTKARQFFGKLGWRNDATDVSITGSYADTDLTGNGLQDVQLLSQDYESVYTKPDQTKNESYLVNLVVTHKLTDTVALSGNAHYRSIQTHTLNGDLNDDSLGESLYQPSADEREALEEAGYTGFPTSGETQANTPFPFWRCVANALTNEEPNEKCNGLINRTRTKQHDAGVSLQATFTAPMASLNNQLIVGVSGLKSAAKFGQSSQFGYVLADRSIAAVDGPGAFADGTQESEDAFDSRVDLDGDTTTRSVYFTDTVELSRVMQLTLSGRYDRTTVDNEDNITAAGEPGSLTAKHRFSRFNPAIGVTFNPSDGLSAYVGYTEGSRAPSSIELGCADPENPCRLPNAMAGDPPLNQVVTRTMEIGARGMVAKHLAWNIGVFRADNRDDILFVADDTSGFGYFKNFGKTRRQGVELGASSQFGPLYVGANYTYLDATYRSTEELLGEGNSSNEEGPGFEGTIDVEPGDRIPLTPRHILKAFAGWDVTEQISLSLDVINIGSSYARGNENNEHEAEAPFYLGPGEIGGYTVLNLGVEYRPMQSLQLFAQVNNLLDREYYTGAQLGSTGFNANGEFVARPFDDPIVDDERPLLGSTFLAPGAPRTYWLGAKFSFSGAQKR
ncbi:TonB-dependent receptor [Steroidobacter agaridevorans]|uniref:TonB-dependent receptor n=1 Tax=Steroidobacter agaridevorans TaxID=2695856 RepID=A0A829YEY8_9GAMM|nr:TonB-dependent receptor [Steroidobacter agaridevorans]GFE81965.1 TonB-dependent receptor [Steroidobacter agaridevorans]